MTAQRGGGYVVVASQRRTTHGYMQFLKIYNFQKLHIAAAPLWARQKSEEQKRKFLNITKLNIKLK